MKKVISIILITVMAAALLAGCGKGSNVTIESAADLDGLAIGCQSGTTGETWVLENCLKKAPNSYKTGMDAAMDLKNGKIDAVILDEYPANAIIKQNSELKILPIDFATEEYAIAVKKGNTQLLETINATIKRMKEDGTYDSLMNAFMPADGNIVIPEDVVSAGGGTISMGTNAAFPPFEYVENDKIVGFDISMSQQIAFDARADLEVKDMAFESLLTALDAGTVDMVAAGLSINETRKKSVDFSEPYFSSKQVIIVKK